MSQDNNNPYQPPQSSLSVEYEHKAPIPGPQKASPLFRVFAVIIGTLMVITGFGRFSTRIIDLGSAFAIFAIGVQFIVAGVTGYWYAWFGRRVT